MPPRPSSDTSRYRPPMMAPGAKRAVAGVGVRVTAGSVGALVSGSNVRSGSMVRASSPLVMAAESVSSGAADVTLDTAGVRLKGASGACMSSIRPAMRSVLLGAAAATVFVTATATQSILGPPSEANHFIETPKGWVHPKTSWGEPDIQATLNMMQAAGVPLERCANSYRFGGPRCDMNKAWWTEEEHKQRIAAAAGRGDLGRQLIEK